MPRGGLRKGAGRPNKSEGSSKKGGARERQKQKRLLQQEKIVVRVCAHCGKTHTTKRTKYCSPECLLAVNKESSYHRLKNNPELKKAYREKAKPELNKRMRERRRTDSSYALSCRMGCLMFYALRKAKGGRKWQDLVGYSVADLRRHIEKKFKGGMTWERFLAGEIHIDHKIPVSAFNYSRPEDIDFKKCWALKNLQPLWDTDNIKKKDNLAKPFQPSLAMEV